MNLKCLLLPLLFLLFATLGQSIDNNNFVVNLRFHINEEKLPEITTYIINNTAEENNITVKDIVKLTRLDAYNLKQFNTLLENYNVTQLFTVDNLEHVLNSLNLEFDYFQNKVTQKLGVGVQTFTSALVDLGINQLEYLSAIAFNKSIIYNVLGKAILDDEHVNKALQTLGKSLDEVFDASKNVFLDEIYNVNITHFVDLLKNHGWNRRSSRILFKALNLTVQEIYNVDSFKNVFDQFSTALNENITIAVVTGKNSIVVLDPVLKRLSSYSEGDSVKIDVNNLEISIRNSKIVGQNIFELYFNSNNEPVDFVAVVDSYTNVSTEECFYLTYKGKDVVSEKIKIVNDGRSFEKNNGTVFNLGSPVICEEVLYGLVASETETEIQINHFYTEAKDDFVNSSNVLSSNYLFIYLIISFVLCYK